MGRSSSKKSDSCTTISSRGHRLRRAYIHQDEQRAWAQRSQSVHRSFVCFSSKAVHLEVSVSAYTTDAFLAALRRFTSRRGLCTDIYSDCGTNFSGADRQLREMLRASSSREYLNNLVTRPKWTKDALPPRLGSLCILRSELSPPNKWPLARITQLHPGDDGVVRVVTIKTASSELIRPLVKLVLLPEEANAFISHASASNVRKSLN